jgi:hypothetical protein
VKFKQVYLGIFFLLVQTVWSVDRPLLQKGHLQGILVSKGEFWIEVKDDKGYAHRYLAPWQGLGPSRGGGFNRAMLSRFEEVIVGNRVSLSWHWDGHLRANEIEILRPSKTSGMFEGYLLEIGDRWIDVQNSDEQIPWRFYLPWVGGYPKNGGGYDHQVIEPLREHKPTDPILFEWNYQLRPRITRLVTREEISFKPFYELEHVPPWLGPPGGVKDSFKTKPVNPFDMLNDKKPNPFDSVAPPGGTLNPFDAVEPKPPSGANPFDSVPKNGGTVNPFEQSAPTTNPFDSAMPAQSPFDQVAPKDASPSNPFDGVPPSSNPNNATKGKSPGINPFDSLEP